MSRRKGASLLASMIVMGVAVSALAQEATQTIQGEVVDPALYLREGRRGPEVEDLIYDAVDGGQTLAVLADGTETLYLFLAGEPGEDPNDLAYDYIGQRVKVTGTVYERGGLRGIVAAAVEPLEAASPLPPEDVILE